MSIAVSAVVKPSRYLLAMVGFMCMGIVFAGLMIGAGQLGSLNLPFRILSALGCTFLAFFGLYYTVQTRKTHHIDISGIGQIRIVEYSTLAASSSKFESSPWQDIGEVVSLMANSTLWSCLLLLRLQHADQRITVLSIFPDSIDAEGFRALSVACHWIAAHNNPTERINL